MKKENANFGSLSIKSWLRGLYYTVAIAVLPMLISLFNSGTITMQGLKWISLFAVSTALTYISTHLFTNSKDQMFTKEIDGIKNILPDEMLKYISDAITTKAGALTVAGMKDKLISEGTKFVNNEIALANLSPEIKEIITNIIQEYLLQLK